MSTRILLADDHAMVRQGLRSMLEKEPDMEVVGEAEDGQKALELVRELLPDIVVMDIEMPNLNGIDATRQIVRELRGVKVIALSMYSDGLIVDNMLKAGASGYVLKDYAVEELVRAIRIVKAGDSYLSPQITGLVIKKGPKLLTDSLTDNEWQIVQMLWNEKSAKQMAAELHVSVNAVDAAKRKIRDKLGVVSDVGIVKVALKEKRLFVDA